MKKDKNDKKFYDSFDEYPRKHKIEKSKKKKYSFKALIHSGDEVDYEYLEKIDEEIKNERLN